MELFAGGVEAYEDGRIVTLDGFEVGSGELGAEGFVVVACEVGAEVFAWVAGFEVGVEEALDGVGAVFGGGAEADLAGDAGVLADGSSEAEVEGVDHFSVLLDFFAFEADVCDPALSAGVGASGDVDADLLVEAGEAVFEFGDEPLVEALGLCDGELAELGAGAGDGSAPEGGGVDVEADAVEFDDECGGFAVGDVGDEDVLPDGGAELSVAVFVGEVGEFGELVAGEATVQDGSSDGAEAGLLLRGDADVIAVDVVGDGVFGDGAGIEFVAEFGFDGFEHGLGGPAVAHEEVLDAGAGAVLAEGGLLLEDADHGGDDFEGLVLGDEGGDAYSEVWLGGEAAADAEGVADLIDTVDGALDGGEGYVVDLWVGAPDGAAGDGDFELAGEVVELGVGGEEVGDLDGEGAGIDEFVAVDASERASGDVTDDVAAGSFGGEVDLGEGVYGFDEGVDGEPVELDVLAGGDVGEVACVLFGEVGDDAGLVGGEQAVGHADAHHEVGAGFAFSAGATGDTEAVALGVDAPPLEVEAGPLGSDGVASAFGVLADFVPCFPGVFGELEALGLLGLGFFDCGGGGCGGEVGHDGFVPFSAKSRVKALDFLRMGQKKKPTG